MKKLTLLFAIVLIAGCHKDAQETHSTTNSDIEVELLFEKDGCKVYRFYDGRSIYWCNCEGSVTYDTGGKHSVDVDTFTTK